MRPVSFSRHESVMRLGNQEVPLLIGAYLLWNGEYTLGAVSCWKLSLLDLVKVVLHRRVYLTVMAQGHPPVRIDTDPVEANIPDMEGSYEAGHRMWAESQTPA